MDGVEFIDEFELNVPLDFNELPVELNDIGRPDGETEKNNVQINIVAHSHDDASGSIHANGISTAANTRGRCVRTTTNEENLK